MYDLPPKNMTQLEQVLAALPQDLRRELNTILALVYNAGYNKGLKSRKIIGDYSHRRR